MQYLWNLGHFSDISIETAKSGTNRTALTFRVVEHPILDIVTFKGNKKIKVVELEKTAALLTGKTVTEQELVTAANKIEKLYATKGYLTAGAEFKLQKAKKPTTFWPSTPSVKARKYPLTKSFSTATTPFIRENCAESSKRPFKIHGGEKSSDHPSSTATNSPKTKTSWWISTATTATVTQGFCEMK